MLFTKLITAVLYRPIPYIYIFDGSVDKIGGDIKCVQKKYTNFQDRTLYMWP